MYGYDFGYTTHSSVNGILIWNIIALVIAVIGGFVVYFLFLKNKGKFTGFVNWLHNFLNFKTLLLEDILKISYVIVAVFITLSSFGYIAVNPAIFFGMLIGGNIGLRIVYEMSILLIKICQNTSEINNKLKK